ncbi:hypothetical protein [Streptomyces sp. NRRL S-118]|uniref:hypothetical protein n=1 Tax=Streptomyces sp. NRRL S-118 TaxID=1463881 RepID=UPI000B1D7ABD|nr:hypothetical protein [Streptomyces sp. NRRL S-118]
MTTEFRFGVNPVAPAAGVAAREATCRCAEDPGHDVILVPGNPGMTAPFAALIA